MFGLEVDHEDGRGFQRFGVGDENFTFDTDAAARRCGEGWARYGIKLELVGGGWSPRDAYKMRIVSL